MSYVFSLIRHENIFKQLEVTRIKKDPALYNSRERDEEKG